MTVIETTTLSEQGVLALARDLIAQGMTPSQAVDELMPLDLDDYAVRVFVRRGIIRTLLDEMHTLRGGEPKQDAEDGSAELWRTMIRFQPKHAHGDAARAMLRVMYEGADGRVKPMLDAELPDLEKWEAEFTAEIKGMTSKVRVLRTAKKLLREHGVERVSELPREALARLDAEVAGAWSA